MSEPLVLLPLRAPGSGLTRLSGTVGAADRARLASAMLADVVHAVRGAGLDDLLAVTAGDDAAAVARELGLPVHAEADADGAGLDRAVEAAIAGRPARAAAAVIMPDLPRLDARDVTALVRADAPVVLAPTADGGTGALVRRPPTVIPTAYGSGSAVRHRRLAREVGVRATVVRSPGFAHDLDTVADLRALIGTSTGPRTAAVLGDLAGALAHAG